MTTDRRSGAASGARRLLKRSLGKLTWVERYRCLTLAWNQAQAVERPRGEVEVRRLEPSELARYASEAEYEITPSFLDAIALRDDLCCAAFVGGELVSYRFFAVRPTAIDAYLRFSFPPGWVYAYKAFTRPAWRGRHLHRYLFLNSLPEAARWLQGLQEPAGFVTLVVSDNLSSSSALTRLGFSPFAAFSVLRVRSRPRLVWSSQDEAGGFRMELAS